MRYLAILFTALAFISGCKDDEVAYRQPEILGFKGMVDTVGATVTIYGYNFSGSPRENTVSFGPQSSTPFFASSDSLKVRVPEGAATGRIQVRVRSLSAMSADTFHVVYGRWRRMSDTPEGGRFDGVGFSAGGKGYIGTGTGTGYRKDMWGFDPAADTWERVADFPGGLRREAVSFTIGGKAYVGYGTNTRSFFPAKDFYEFDPVTGAWTRKADIPGSNNTNTVGFSIAGKGYVVTGAFSKDVLEYDPQRDSWTVKSEFPGPRRVSSSGFVIGGRGYLVGGGSGGTVHLKDLWEYDPGSDVWTRRRDIPVGGYEGVGFTLGGKGYVGLQGQGNRGFWCYDPLDDSWTRKPDFPGIAWGHASSFTLGNAAYVANGVLANAVSAEVWRFEDKK